jgi:uncharacterized membrane protein
MHNFDETSSPCRGHTTIVVFNNIASLQQFFLHGMRDCAWYPNCNQTRYCSCRPLPIAAKRPLDLHMHNVHRFFHHRPRLTISSLIGIGTALSIPFQMSWITRTLLAWNIAAWSYLIMMGWLMMRADHARVRTIAQQEDRSGVAVLSIMSVASMASIAAIILELATTHAISTELKLMHYGLTAATVIGSWCLIGTLYTFHYARLFYTAPHDQRPLKFPDDEVNPNYWDFLYFSFTIAVAVQTSDIAVMSRSMRKTVLAQSVLSFIFNVAIVGLSINIAASVVGS